MSFLVDWLDRRTGYKKLLAEALYENIPGGARWRYVWGSTLMFTLSIQFITGIALWMCYSAGAQTAWESVYYVQTSMNGGWFLRGLHHYSAQAMNILLVLHLMQVVVDGAYKAPREMNFWFGLALLVLTMGLSLTGYLLPWDQKGYWATKVATSIAGITPVVGARIQQVIVGGTDYGHLTLTRFFALHAGVLPAAIIILLTAHIYLFRYHGITSKKPHRRPDAPFWPDQVLSDTVACLAVLAAVLCLVISHHGAELGAPADPSEQYSAARPEWYFLFLFQFLKYFPGGTEIWGAMIIPGLIMGVVFLMPFIGRWRLGHRFNVGFLVAIGAGAGLLTLLALNEDRRNPEYQAAVKQAEIDAERVRELAQSPRGIPVAGAVTLLRDDPLTQGPKLFKKNCASCHRFEGRDGTGRELTEAPRASDLAGFGGRAWVEGMVDPKKISTPHFLGASKMKDGKMAKFVQKDVTAYTPAQKADLAKIVAALSAEAQLPAQAGLDARDKADIAAGAELMRGDFRCAECHQFHKPDPDATAPDLTGYASRAWLVDFISNPSHARFYGKRNDRMPAFGDDKVLDPASIGMLADWLRGDWYRPNSAAPASVRK
jgi:ubiquinol-cytochrome c reductase cytochrome b subunit